MQEINIKAQGNRRKSDMIISLVRYRRKRDTIISFVRYGEEHSSFPFWEGAGAFSTILERKEGDRHWNKGRRRTLEQRKVTDILEQRKVENILGRSGKIGASETSAKKRKKTLTRL